MNISRTLPWCVFNLDLISEILMRRNGNLVLFYLFIFIFFHDEQENFHSFSLSEWENFHSFSERTGNFPQDSFDAKEHFYSFSIDFVVGTNPCSVFYSSASPQRTAPQGTMSCLLMHRKIPHLFQWSMGKFSKLRTRFNFQLEQLPTRKYVM